MKKTALDRAIDQLQGKVDMLLNLAIDELKAQRGKALVRKPRAVAKASDAKSA